MDISDSVILSMIQGEQVRLHVSLDWLTNISGYSITVKTVEADMTVLNASGYPTNVLSGGVVTSLPTIDSNSDDAEFDIVFTQTLGTDHSVQPTPNNPIYAFVELEIADTGVGTAQQIWKPLRGLVEIRYSPTEAS